MNSLKGLPHPLDSRVKVSESAMMFTKQFDRRVYIASGVLAFSATLGLAFGAFVLWPSRREAGYMPRQPIAYSHQLHAGELQIECMYCHTNADKGPNATVPPVSTCMKCHEKVQTKDDDGNITSATATLLRYAEDEEPIIWNKVHDVADFVYFDHSRHIAADLECQECHGPIETYEHMRRTCGQKMSWCLDCHKEAAPETDDAGGETLEQRGPIHCSACHR